MDVIESNFRRAMRLGTAGDENNFTAQTARAIRGGNCNSVGVLKSCLTADELDLMQREVFENALPFHFDDFAFMAHEVVHGEIFFQRVVNAVKASLLQPGKIKGGFAQRFAGDGAGVDATAAGMLGAFNDGDTLAEIGGLSACFFAGRSATDYQQVKLFLSRH